MSNQALLEPLWAFARRDLPAVQFRDWLYGIQALEDVVGTAFHLDLLDVNFDDPRAVAEIRAQLRAHLLHHHAPQCDCPLTGSREQLPVGASPLDRGGFAILRRRTPWLELVRCRTCATLWYIATDSYGGDYYMQRLSEAEAAAIVDADRWPADFDDRPVFWPEPAWLSANGYVDLEDWQRRHGAPQT